MHEFRKKYCLMFAMLLFICSAQVQAQINHFIYLQTDNQQPFYIKFNSKIYSSTASGYLILSKLAEGTIGFSIGFPQSQLAEQKFELLIDRAEKGFLIKNFNEKGWGLFDLQSSIVIYTANTQVNPIQPTNNTSNPESVNDPFVSILSTVTQDSTIKNVTTKKEEKVKIDTPKQTIQNVIQPQIKVDSPKIEIVAVPVIPKIENEPVWSAPQKSIINKIRFFESKEGSDLIYELKNENGTTDTVRLFIPGGTSQQTKPQLVINEPLVQKDSIPAVMVEIPSQQTFVKKEEPEKKEEKLMIPIEKKNELKSVPNTNCLSEANEDDFIKLRRKMAGQSKDEAMVNEAKKVFKTKCFSTAQLKNLSVLFLSDEWRYRFYDAALPFVTDLSNFKSLEETLKEDYYIKRFQALLPN